MVLAANSLLRLLGGIIMQKKVGENTNGTFHFSNTGTAVLPNSKFKVLIPSQYSEYYDRRFIERLGIEPDIRVPPGEDAYMVAKKTIMAN